MRAFFVLLVHLLVQIAQLMQPGGARAIVAENLLLKQQLPLPPACPSPIGTGSITVRLVNQRRTARFRVQKAPFSARRYSKVLTDFR